LSRASKHANFQSKIMHYSTCLNWRSKQNKKHNNFLTNLWIFMKIRFLRKLFNFPISKEKWEKKIYTWYFTLDAPNTWTPFWIKRAKLGVKTSNKTNDHHLGSIMIHISIARVEQIWLCYKVKQPIVVKWPISDP